MCRAGIMAIVILIAGCSKGEELKTLSSSEIDKLLKGNTIEGILVAQSRPIKQYFGADGITVQVLDSKRIGDWYVDDNDQFCIRWNPAKKQETMAKDARTEETEKAKNKKGQCLSVKQDINGKYRIYSADLGYAATLLKIVPGNPGKL